MKKSLCKILILFITFSGIAFAEESGIIIGVGAGYGNGEFKTDATQKSQDGDTTGGGADIGVIAGYKLFFLDSIGLRIYGNFNYQPSFDFGRIGGEQNKQGDIKTNMMNYGINADLLYNFLAGENFNLGIFAGLGLGVNTFGGDTIKQYENMPSMKDKLKKHGFDASLNVGVRTNFYKNFGIEIGAKIPFVENTLLDASNMKMIAWRKYSIDAMLVFSF